ncbi:MAG: hypothetical protein NTX33_06195 [Propionibacteriales bacterium]|nr:hypothetical protein [Propionibacteriales bacterium]
MSEYDVRLTDRVRTRGPLKPDDAASFLLPVAEELAALHASGHAHGALSPAAIQVDSDGRATLVDPAVVAPDPAFAPPDPTWGLRPHPLAEDVWSFAAVLLHVTTGRTPGVDDTDRRKGGWLAPLIELALQVDPKDRPTMSDVVDYLRAQVAGSEPAPRRLSGLALVIAGAAVIVGLAVVGAALLLGGGGDGEDRDPSRSSNAAATRDNDRATEEATATASAEPVSAAELEEFARTYVSTASQDPQRGYDLLTRTYQQASPRYREVWEAIEDPQIVSVAGDPANLSVSYTYTYRYEGVRRTEDITLRLVQQGGRLLIAGASGRLR